MTNNYGIQFPFKDIDSVDMNKFSKNTIPVNQHINVLKKKVIIL